MDSSDLTIQVLREIRDEIRQTNGRLDQTNGRLDQTNARLEKLEERQAQGEVRLSTELLAVTKAVDSVRQLLADRLDLRDRIDAHDRRISALEDHAGE